MARRTPLERFWNFVEVQPSGCWLWTSANNERYGFLWVDGGNRLAHRFAYEQFRGPIADGGQIDHLCEVGLCVNPDHMEVVTAHTNTLRSSRAPAAANARKTHCQYGHPFDAANTVRTIDGRRECRECIRRRGREAKRRERAALGLPARPERWKP